MLNLVKHNIEKRNDKYSDTITVTGMISHAKFFKWHESIPDAMRTFCKLAMVDSMLIEVCLGIKFDDLSKE